MSSIKVRVITSFAIIAIVIPPLVLGGIWLDLLAAFIVLSGGYELLGLSENVRKWPKWLIPMEILFVWALLFGVSEKLAFPLLGVMVLLAMSMPVISKAVDGRDVFLLSVYLCIFYLFGMSFLKLYAKDPLYFWFMAIATYLCDTAAFFCGSLFGKHKLCPRISPKKTLEGAIGGWLVACIGAFLFACCVDLGGFPLWARLLASMILPFSAQIGDLAFSAIKRFYGIKDFSSLLPGHGGVLDRIDSLVFNFVVFYALLVVRGI